MCAGQFMCGWVYVHVTVLCDVCVYDDLLQYCV